MEGFGFAEDGYEDDGWVGHALDIAHIWSEDVEELEELADICDETALRLILRLTVERSLYILLDLHPHLLNHPVLLSPLQQLQVQRVTHPHSVLHQIRPHHTPQLLRHKIFNQRQALLPKDRHSQLRVPIRVDDLIPILQEGVTFNTHFLLLHHRLSLHRSRLEVLFQHLFAFGEGFCFPARRRRAATFPPLD